MGTTTPLVPLSHPAHPASKGDTRLLLSSTPQADPPDPFNVDLIAVMLN
jgi:hypothetical protein